MEVKWRHYYVKVMSSNHASQHILEPFFRNKNAAFNGEQEKKYIIFCEDRIEKSITQNHHLSSLGKPRDAKR